MACSAVIRSLVGLCLFALALGFSAPSCAKVESPPALPLCLPLAHKNRLAHWHTHTKDFSRHLGWLVVWPQLCACGLRILFLICLGKHSLTNFQLETMRRPHYGSCTETMIQLPVLLLPLCLASILCLLSSNPLPPESPQKNNRLRYILEKEKLESCKSCGSFSG